jgi:PhnB protein
MSKIELAPYIFFKGDCRQAMEQYERIFGGELEMTTYDQVPGDFPGKSEMSGKVMNASLATERGFVIRASDTQKASPKSKKVELCLTGEDEEGLRKIFDSLSAEGDVTKPLEKEFWGDIFGQVTDKFGVEWMIDILPAK